ncbi:hypothetical protein EVAR_100672_1 [Eumeta japonica]|uniref:Uncharacterized protein n=1 Tax=Eumeta variegata TaxID=151549 RepID=A0A4C2A2D4_EUMVA|nr:hypothetical protein EVAR_100672_1 [Eumeta japonica]
MLPGGRIEQLRRGRPRRSCTAPRPLNGDTFYSLQFLRSARAAEPGSMRTLPSFIFTSCEKGERPVTGRGSTHSAPSPATGRARVAQYPRTATSAERRASPARAAAVNTR